MALGDGVETAHAGRLPAAPDRTGDDRAGAELVNVTGKGTGTDVRDGRATGQREKRQLVVVFVADPVRVVTDPQSGIGREQVEHSDAGRPRWIPFERHAGDRVE